MAKQVAYFGGITHGRLIHEHNPKQEIRFDRDIWFDRDINGRWLVGVTTQHDSGDETTQAIAIKHDTVNDFISVLASLVADPDELSDGTLTIGPAWDGLLPS